MKYYNVQENVSLAALPESMTCFATIDEKGIEQPVTEFMIRRACEQMDANELWPLADAYYQSNTKVVPQGGASIIPFRKPIN